MFENVFTTIFAVSVTTGIIILALVLLSSRLNRSYVAKWKYWVWLLLAVRLLIPFQVTFPGAPVQVSVPDTTIPPIFSPQTPSTVPDFTPAAPDLPIQSAARSMSLWELFSIIWLAGAVLFLAYQFAGCQRCRHEALRWSRAAKDKRLYTALDQLCVEMEIGGEVTLLISQKVSGPMIIGFFRSYLLLPHEDYADNELVHILRHELVHLKRRDIWYKLLMLLTTALHWFNPAVHLMLREANKDLELACDDETIKNLPFDARKEYSDTIIHCIRRQHSKHTALSTYFYGGEKAMKERFVNILSYRKKRAGKVAGAAVILCVLLMGGMVACDTLNTPQVDLADYDLLYEQYLHLPFRSLITSETWDNANDIPPDYFVNYYAYYWHDNYYQGGPLNFPPEELESYIQEYFDVSAEHIRTADQYDVEEDVYICFGLGGGGSSKVVGAEQNGKRLILDYEVYSPEDDVTVIWSGTLTVELSKNGYKYVANEMHYIEGGNSTNESTSSIPEESNFVTTVDNGEVDSLLADVYNLGLLKYNWVDRSAIGNIDALVDFYGYVVLYQEENPNGWTDSPKNVSVDEVVNGILRYFDEVTAEDVKESVYYDAENGCLSFYDSYSSTNYTAQFAITEQTKDDDKLIISYKVTNGYDGSAEGNGVVTLRETGSGYKFLSNEFTDTREPVSLAD